MDSLPHLLLVIFTTPNQLWPETKPVEEAIEAKEKGRLSHLHLRSVQILHQMQEWCCRQPDPGDELSRVSIIQIAVVQSFPLSRHKTFQVSPDIQVWVPSLRHEVVVSLIRTIMGFRSYWWDSRQGGS